MLSDVVFAVIVYVEGQIKKAGRRAEEVLVASEDEALRDAFDGPRTGVAVNGGGHDRTGGWGEMKDMERRAG